jgi:serpin B
MLIFLPDEDRFEEFEAALDSELITDTLDNLTPTQVELSLPKFKVESTFSLNEALAALGMPDAFDADKADFSGMTGQPDLFISSVVHKAFVDVNEAGTEAAAATAVIMELKAMPSESVTLKINRPFIFAIIDRETGTILFMGRVLDPR